MVEKPIGAEFMWRTRYQEQAPSDQRLGEPQPSLEMPLDPEAELIDLAPCDAAARSRVDLVDAITQRMSVRQYADRAMTLDELALLLWCTQGVKEIVPGLATMRTVPSAGARHALETYLVVHRVGDLSRGVYRYVATQHKLVRLREGPEVADELVRACVGQKYVATGAVTFVWVADAYRMTWRYGQRGYRYLHLDAGHACQNLYLAVEAVGCGCCGIAAFDDDALNHMLGLDGESQFAIYVAPVGKRR